MQAASRIPPLCVKSQHVEGSVYETLAVSRRCRLTSATPSSSHFQASHSSVSESLETTRYFFFTVNVIKAPFTIGMGLLRLEHLPLIALLAPVALTCAWVGRRLAARIPLRVFEPLVIATTIVATVPMLTS